MKIMVILKLLIRLAISYNARGEARFGGLGFEKYQVDISRLCVFTILKNTNLHVRTDPLSTQSQGREGQHAQHIRRITH